MTFESIYARGLQRASFHFLNLADFNPEDFESVYSLLRSAAVWWRLRIDFENVCNYKEASPEFCSFLTALDPEGVLSVFSKLKKQQFYFEKLYRIFMGVFMEISSQFLCLQSFFVRTWPVFGSNC